MITAGDIYKAIDAFAPFCTQEKWDNSGLLAGDMDMPADKIYVTIDISNEAVERAAEAGAQLIVAHHPIIFSPLKSLGSSHPVWKLAASGIAAICVHTPLDMSAEGINARLYGMLKDGFSLGEITCSLEDFGWIAESGREFTAKETAKSLKKLLGCSVVRYCSGNRPIRKIAVCSGSGSSLLEEASAMGCDAFVTGDVKHDRWYAAKNMGISLFDCGHYHTELISQDIIAEKLKAAFPQAEIICDNSGDPVSYIFEGAEI